MSTRLKTLRLFSILSFLLAMAYLSASAYQGHWVDLFGPTMELRVATHGDQLGRVADPEDIPMGTRPPAWGEIQDPSMATRISLPGGFEIEMPEGGSWWTVARMLSLLLLGYLGVRLINLVFNRLERSRLPRARKA